MTAVMEAPAANAELAARREAAFAEMTRNQTLFDATRPPCPASWCDGMCETDGHFGTAILHESIQVEVPTEADRIDATGSILVRAQRHDSLTDLTTGLVEVDTLGSGSEIEERFVLTAVQARRFATELMRHADLIDPEPEVPAADVRVGDWLPVGDQWLYIYSVCVDEPSNTVQISTTVARGEWPELDGDEDPHRFEPGDMVRIRRGGAR